MREIAFGECSQYVGNVGQPLFTGIHQLVHARRQVGKKAALSLHAQSLAKVSCSGRFHEGIDLCFGRQLVGNIVPLTN